MRDKDDNVNHQAGGRGDDLSDQVMEALHDVVHRLRAHHHAALREAGSELTPWEARALAFFARHPGATQSDLAQHAGRDKAQVTRLVQGLRERGWLDAEVDAADRRVTRLQPSEQARREVLVLQRRRSAVAKAALSGLDADERARLLELLGRLRDALQ